MGLPAGSPFTDFQGVIVRPGVDWESPRLLRGAGLVAWQFDHVLADQLPLRPYVVASADSPFIDLNGGFQAYAKRRRVAGSTQIKKVNALARKLEREHGPVRFEARISDPQALNLLLSWKSTQCIATGHPDSLRVPWVRSVLHGFHDADEGSFEGMLWGSTWATS